MSSRFLLAHHGKCYCISNTSQIYKIYFIKCFNLIQLLVWGKEESEFFSNSENVHYWVRCSQPENVRSQSWAFLNWGWGGGDWLILCHFNNYYFFLLSHSSKNKCTNLSKPVKLKRKITFRRKRNQPFHKEKYQDMGHFSYKWEIT